MAEIVPLWQSLRERADAIKAWFFKYDLCDPTSPGEAILRGVGNSFPFSNTLVHTLFPEEVVDLETHSITGMRNPLLRASTWAGVGGSLAQILGIAAAVLHAPDLVVPLYVSGTAAKIAENAWHMFYNNSSFVGHTNYNPTV